MALDEDKTPCSFALPRTSADLDQRVARGHPKDKRSYGTACGDRDRGIAKAKPASTKQPLGKHQSVNRESCRYHHVEH